jgi:sporulation protein YlmC with PRC-barrel domain
MRSYLPTAAILAAALCALPTKAEDNQPAPSASSDNYNEGIWQTVLPYQDVQGVLGKEVRGSAGEDLGRVVDVLVDQGGQARAAVIDFGGFLGVGSRRIVVDWATLHFAPADQRDRITLDLTRAQVRAAPEYKAGAPIVMFGGLGPMAAPGR